MSLLHTPIILRNKSTVMQVPFSRNDRETKTKNNLEPEGSGLVLYFIQGQIMLNPEPNIRLFDRQHTCRSLNILHSCKQYVQNLNTCHIDAFDTCRTYPRKIYIINVHFTVLKVYETSGVLINFYIRKFTHTTQNLASAIIMWHFFFQFHLKSLLFVTSVSKLPTELFIFELLNKRHCVTPVYAVSVAPSHFIKSDKIFNRKQLKNI